jgi:WD40 repeat protein
LKQNFRKSRLDQSVSRYLRVQVIRHSQNQRTFSDAMKTWFSNIFGKDKKPRAADGSEAVPPQASAEQTIPADTERTVLASAPADPVAIHAAEVQVTAEWQVGDVILDLYEVKHVFEGGGMGLVYRVHHRGWNTDLAVKSPRSDYFKTETQKENFTRECETWINLGLHPHIVSCHYVRTLGGIPRVFAEYVEGGTLKEWIDSRKLYEGGEQETLKRILEIAIQMAWGLHYAHEKGVIHQDVKPANVLTMPDGTAKVTDFGLAKAQAATDQKTIAGKQQSILVSSGGMTPAYDNTLRLWDIGTGKCSSVLCGHDHWVFCGVFSADSRLIVSGSKDKTIRFWDLGSGTNLDIFKDHIGTVFSIALGADSRLALSGDGQGVLRLWDLKDKKRHRTLSGHSSRVGAVALSADERWALSGSWDKTLRFWDVQTAHCVREISDQMDRVEAVAISPDGRLVLSANQDAQLRNYLVSLWDVGNGKLIKTFNGHTKEITSVAFSPDGRWALSGSHDNTVRLWEVSSGNCIRMFEAHAGMVSSVAFSVDGRWIISGNEDNSVRLWELEWDYEFPEPKNWDEGAKPFLVIFLTLHCSLGEDGLTRIGEPAWTDDHFQNLLTDLQYRGYGWLRPEGVRQQLKKMTAEWQGPPSMPWEQTAK